MFKIKSSKIILAILCALITFLLSFSIVLAGSGTSTFYTFGTSDGETIRSTTGTWAQITGGNGTQSGNDATDVSLLALTDMDSPNWNSLYRGLLYFDTSDLPDDATIVSATLSLYGESKTDDLNITPGLVIYNTTSANTVVSTADYQTVGTTAMSDTTISYAGYNTSGYNDFPLNAAGLAAISKTGYSRFAGILSYDGTRIAPTWGGAFAASTVNYYCAEKGAAYAPKLVVNYTTPSAAPYESVTDIYPIVLVAVGILGMLMIIATEQKTIGAIILVAIMIYVLTNGLTLFA